MANKRLRVPQGEPTGGGQISQITGDILDLPVYTRGNKRIIDDIARRGLPLPENPTVRDYVVSSVVMRTAERGRVDDLLTLMELTGEKLPENEGDTLQKAREILAGLESVIN